MTLNEQLKSEIETLLKSNDVVLFMKGTPRAPQCGFSATVAGILDELLPEYRTVNVLERADLREGIKEYANWPTIPQLYVKGELVGGADIVKSLAAKGELPKMLGVTVAEVKRPNVTVTPTAQKELQAALADEGGKTLRFEIDRRFQCSLGMDEAHDDDFSYDIGNGATLLVDRQSARRAEGVVIDFVTKNGTAGFKITNPNEPPKVQGMSPKELKAKLGEVTLLDVRTPEERALAQIDGARLLDADADKFLSTLDKNSAVLVFHCHHGQRSAAAAQHYLGLGFKNVFNLEGGIAAWSRDVDPSVPGY